MAIEETTIADILKERNAKIAFGEYSLQWSEDRLLGSWVIENRKGEVFAGIEEFEAADKFLQLTSGMEYEHD